MKKNKNQTLRIIIIVILLLAIFISIGVVAFVNRYYPVRHVEIIYKHADEFEVDRSLVFAVINAESRFRERAQSAAGARGLMQIMEGTANWIAPMAGLNDFDYEQIFDPDINIRLGVYYLSMLMRWYGSAEVALCAYNAGPGNVDKWLENPEYSSDGKTLDFIPFAETRAYVSRVMDYQRMYELILRFR